MVQDSELQQAVLAELGRQAGARAAHIRAAASAGMVTLTGHVGSFADRHAAEAAAWRVGGVSGVAVAIAVRPPSAQRLHAIFGLSDAVVRPLVEARAVGDQIMHALHRSWFFDEETVHVSAVGGNIRLTGTVRSARERRVAAQTAWGAPGATSVENDLVVI
jgi:osmotically-inducible protein OsmY